MRKLLVAVLGVFIAAGSAMAQDKPVEINFGGGWMFPATEGVRADFNAGWNGVIGVAFNVNPKVGILAEYQYSRMNGPDKTINVSTLPIGGVTSTALIESNHQMHTGLFDVIYRVKQKDSIVGGYVLAGGGVYHRMIQLTTPTVGYTSICDPYWYVCYPALVSVDTIIGDRSSNDFGINIGGGVTFGEEAKFYIEARYHYVWGPTIQPAVNPLGTTTCSGGCSTNASYFPLTFGFRF